MKFSFKFLAINFQVILYLPNLFKLSFTVDFSLFKDKQCLLVSFYFTVTAFKLVHTPWSTKVNETEQWWFMVLSDEFSGGLG